MPTALDARLKTALDESRLLILGAQVLFGFTFQGTFQELFEQLSPTAVRCPALANRQRGLSNRTVDVPVFKGGVLSTQSA
jgi:hypothetical protein